jgi:hypothetical protein
MRFKVFFYAAFMLLPVGICALPSSGQAQEKNRQWSYCAQDSDCVVVGGGCFLGTVHKDFKVEAEAYYAEKNTLAECGETLDPATAKAACTHSKVPCMSETGEIDHESICVSKKAKCTLVEQDTDSFE